ncbi:unnamed protein product [Pedinophyceae sp. YPF-701]|nr:unnamed protein product [Pedinophyceae sp. YPF-701]
MTCSAGAVALARSLRCRRRTCSRSSSDTARRWMDRESSMGAYEAAEQYAHDVFDRPRQAIAALIRCDPQEVAIVSSATQAWQAVVYGMEFKPGDVIVTAPAEYGSNYLTYVQLKQRFGIEIAVCPEDAGGDLDLQELDRLLQDPGCKLLSFSHIPTSSGRVYDAAGAGAVARRRGGPFVLDACQTAGQIPIDVANIQCDFLTATGRKYLRAPRGCGFLYASHAAMQWHKPATLDVWGAVLTDDEGYELQPSARRYEQYEMSFAARVGLGVAADEAVDALQNGAWDRIQELAQYLRERLAGVPGVAVHDVGKQLCGIVSFTLQGRDAEEVKMDLRARGINVSVSRWTSTMLDFRTRGLESVLRASVHYYNTRGDIDKLVAALTDA